MAGMLSRLRFGSQYAELRRSYAGNRGPRDTRRRALTRGRVVDPPPRGPLPETLRRVSPAGGPGFGQRSKR
jgi:hypothetical protein